MTPHVDRAQLARFFKKVIPLPSGCWLWSGYRNPSNGGYGTFHWTEKRMNTTAHRVAYAWFVGPVEKDQVIDHLCRNPYCVNPAHLEAVSQSVNAQRALCGTRRLRCRRGHPMTADNIYPQRNYGEVIRTCLVCRRLRELRRQEKRRLVKAAIGEGVDVTTSITIRRSA